MKYFVILNININFVVIKMKYMFKVKLPIWFKTPECINREDMGLDTNLEDCYIKDVIFYNIDAITEYIEEGETGCTIYAAGDSFVSSYSVREVENIIDFAKLKTDKNEDIKESSRIGE